VRRCVTSQNMSMKMTIFLIFCVLLMLSSNLEAKSFCKTNGCSIPGNLPYFYKNYFAPACDKHDVCYACGKRNGWSRQQCDSAFKRDMKNLCQKRGWDKKLCLAVSSNYYSAVRHFGSGHYEIPSLWWCVYCPTSKGKP